MKYGNHIFAEIFPDKSLALINLREKVIKYQELIYENILLSKEKYFLGRPFEANYLLFDNKVELTVDVRNGKIHRISANTGYEGLLFNKIKVGMIVKDVMALDDRWYYDEAEDLMFCKNVKGVSLTLSEDDPYLHEVPNLIIQSISVYAHEIETLEGDDGAW